MMQSMVGCGWSGGWIMAGVGVIVLALVGLAIAALLKYLVSGGRGPSRGAEPWPKAIP